MLRTKSSVSGTGEREVWLLLPEELYAQSPLPGREDPVAREQQREEGCKQEDLSEWFACAAILDGRNASGSDVVHSSVEFGRKLAKFHCPAVKIRK